MSEFEAWGVGHVRLLMAEKCRWSREMAFGEYGRWPSFALLLSPGNLGIQVNEAYQNFPHSDLVTQTDMGAMDWYTVGFGKASLICWRREYVSYLNTWESYTFTPFKI